MDRDALAQWLAVLDRISYYELLSVPPRATYDELQDAFHRFADDFHPDAHLGRPNDERDAIATIFKRGAEAYRVLSEPPSRASYDEGLARGVLRADTSNRSSPRARAASAAGGRLIDRVRTQAARPFVVRAEELAKKGDAKQAKLQLVLAMHLDPGNEALERFAKELEDAARRGT